MPRIKGNSPAGVGQVKRYSDKPVPFLGLLIPIDEYDDDSVACAFIWRHYGNLMTPLERRRGEYSVPIVSNSESEKVRRLYAYLEERDGHVPDEQTVAASHIPTQQWRETVATRLRLECHRSIDFNRCADCGKIPRSPAARQYP